MIRSRSAGGQLGRPFGQQFFPEHPNFRRPDTELAELFGINGIQLFFPQQRNMNRIDVRIQHGFRQTGVRTGAGWCRR